MGKISDFNPFSSSKKRERALGWRCERAHVMMICRKFPPLFSPFVCVEMLSRFRIHLSCIKHLDVMPSFSPTYPPIPCRVQKLRAILKSGKHSRSKHGEKRGQKIGSLLSSFKECAESATVTRIIYYFLRPL